MIKIIKKHGIELRFWVVSIILFSGIFGLFTLGFHDAANVYNSTDLVNPTIEENYNQLSQQESLVGELQTAVQGDEGLKLLNILGTVFTATIGVLNAVISSITFIPSVFANFGEHFGIPSSVTNLFFTIVSLIVTTIIIFAILNVIRR